MEEIKEKFFRFPVELNEELAEILYALKKKDRTWSANKIVIEAVRYYLHMIKMKQQEKVKK